MANIFTVTSDLIGRWQSRPMPERRLKYRGRKCDFCRNKFGDHGVSKYVKMGNGVTKEVCASCFKAMQ
jgi:hypothetical protein